MNITFTGLQKFSIEKESLENDLHNLQNIIESETMHLGDIVSGLRSIQISLEIKAKKLQSIFEEQKK